jgi:hypothetical protein
MALVGLFETTKLEFSPPKMLLPHPTTKATIIDAINQFNGLVKIPNFFILLLLLKIYPNK